MRKNWFFILLLLGMPFGVQQAFAIEIIPTPLKDPFGPNDWIEIDIEIDDYFGGDVQWEATRPDGSIKSGELSSFKASKKDRKSTRLNSSHSQQSRMPSSA